MPIYPAFIGFEIEELKFKFNHLSTKIFNLINQYEETLGYKHGAFKKSKLLSNIDNSLKDCLNIIPPSGRIEPITIFRKYTSWFPFSFSTEFSDDYFLFRSFKSNFLYLIGIDPSFFTHAKKGYIKDSKIYVTIAIFNLNFDNNEISMVAFQFNGDKNFYCDNLSSNSSNSNNLIENKFSKTNYDNFENNSKNQSTIKIKNKPILRQNEIEFQQSNIPISLVYYPIRLGNHKFAYEKNPPRWFVQQSLLPSRECWMRRAVALSHHLGPLKHLKTISRPVVYKNNSPILAVYLCRFGDLSHLLYSPESYIIRKWLSHKPFVFLEFILQLLEIISRLHLQQVDLTPYALVQGKSLLFNKEWPSTIPDNKSFISNKRLVHTDLKLENILFQPLLYISTQSEQKSINFKFELEITDFDGLANEGQQMQGNTTPGYVSPQMEYAYNNKLCYFASQLDDAFATGEILFRICRVVLPFESPFHISLYQNCFKKIISLLKFSDIKKRISVLDAHSSLLDFISSLSLFKKNVYQKSINLKVLNKQIKKLRENKSDNFINNTCINQNIELNNQIDNPTQFLNNEEREKNDVINQNNNLADETTTEGIIDNESSSSFI